MEKLHFFMVLFLNLQFPSFLLLSSASALPTKYFINCGSVSNISLSGREFVGDMNLGSFSFGSSSAINTITTNSSTDSSLYQTARIFKNQASFDFHITDFGIYYVRVHFFPFSSGRTNLADAHFDVSAFNFSLLSNFRIQDNSNSPLIKEYLLTINATKFSIHFTPRRKSFAFVSAIEVFLVPDQDFVEDDFDLITPSGLSNDRYYGVRSQVLLTIRRVDVGGPQNSDSLWRNWIPDDKYRLPGESGKPCVRYEGTLHYNVNGANNYSASDLVYKTCRELNLDSSKGSSNSSKITWRFDVSRSATHLVRLHFCDIISKNASDVFFNLFFYGEFTHMISTNNISQLLAAPLYYDLVVESDDSGSMDISVGPRQDSKNKTAYLNGVEIMEFMRESSLVDVPGNKNRRHIYVIVGTVCGVAFVFIVMVLFLLGIKYKKAKQGDDGVGSWPVFHGKDTTRKGRANASFIRSLNLELKMPLLQIQDATHNFDPKLLIGEGGFGKVYKGTLQNGMTVAVKRSDQKHGQGLPEFETEVLVLSKIRHLHLVSLIGYCEERFEMILVYEFMENGTLRDHLYDPNEKSKRSSKRSKLSWKQRLEICIGSAKGLHYLHTCSHGGIIHRDVKSTNILLNKNYVAKVADFGLSKSGPNDPDHFSVGIKGSFGYMDPEYFRSFQFTEKSDVYSFGVVLLEVLCARPAIINSTKREEINLAEWGMLWQMKGQLENIIDPLLVGGINPDSLRKFGETAEKCLKGDEANRPTMRDVIWDLEYALQLHQTAVHREPHEDTTTNAFFVELPLLNSIPDWEDNDLLIGGEVDGSDTTDGGVFSQLRVDAAR
ncbi:probable receptor-like protein kinase At5g24010 [Carya illinoinensis]|uniref:probable receptor-like protein kinase At5g24010 n=1 Tax=Carya illinoinensis TaxID=32201 RepID=UPI001C71C76D|nr:probable receptor-like protein kinase At5g24010 [Carya illinoinensis]